ncbi:uncharacterized protein Nmag_1814 [Natrialba magadii ATCC 43099]|uniref:Lipoprotein n=1 Tax=Natrialba magadii (strain ATCC 43099 / DSM 3394 / CCM 3739 / CIP 104546 / IAM 13178 / JCM 8861 / NBRC 102185 / NCIMB 2190 / MS3) TaxID=547559 RepID=D3SUY0_NATMM|nr:hypothetical protein [Natrialba magadii]ADD05388.1 uncharacterized protein Nmag_1814 [Natrialba magadii ATCC 43099]ELY29297.1 hypothetical protein C500_11285 [Natrialba magadii ATCC 43099]
MCPPRSRRPVLASVASLSALTAGCSTNWFSNPETASSNGESTPTGTDADCTAVSRPTAFPPASANGDIAGLEFDALEYPPDPAKRAQSALAYVGTLERAYRQQAFLAGHGDQARDFELSIGQHRLSAVADEDWDHDSEDDRDQDGVLVSLVYDLVTETVHTEHAEWDVRVTYFLNDRVALRAQYDGIGTEPSFDPDPRTEGELVACSERS